MVIDAPVRLCAGRLYPQYWHQPEHPTQRDTGTLVLLKATAIQKLHADLHSYRREHPEFPNQSTVDQFFDEKQFDACRELGYATAYRMLRDVRPGLPHSPHDLATTAADLLFGSRHPHPPGAPPTGPHAEEPRKPAPAPTPGA